MSQDLRTIPVALGDRSYDILIKPGLLNDSAAIIAERVKGRRALIVTDTNIAPKYAKPLSTKLTQAKFEGFLAILPPGEGVKTLKNAAELYNQCLAAGLDRDSLLIALGGGVVGDLTGFVAATYYRGVPFVQIPTTLLAMVDASIGGKTGVDHPLAKNAIGAFHQPRAVIIDPQVLTTLPPRDLKAGLAEVIKYGVIDDTKLFEYVETNIAKLLGGDADALAHVIERSASIKARIVSEDELEKAGGPRALLNYGHTFAHSIEACTQYTVYLHGEAVAIGMCMAADLSVTQGLLTRADRDRLKALVKAAGLPVKLKPGDPDTATLYTAMFKDKKVAGGKLRFILAEKMGKARTVTDVPEAQVKEALDGNRE